MVDLKKIQEKINRGTSRVALRPRKSQLVTPEATGTIVEQLEPLMRDIRSAIQAISITVNPEVRTPNVYIPEIKVPAPIVNVTVPEIKVPEQKFVMPDMFRTSTELQSNSASRPLYTMAVDQGGKPVQFSMGASGGKGDFFTIKDIRGSSASLIDQVEGALKVTGNFTVSGSASSTLAQLVNADGTSYNSDNPFPVTITSGANGTTSVVGDGASGATDPDNSNPVKVGGKYNSTIPTFTDGQRGDIQLSSRGSVRVELTGAGSPQGIANIADNADAVAASSTTNKLAVLARLTLYDSIADQWNRVDGGSGVSNTGTIRVVHAVDVGTSVNVIGATGTIATNLVDSTGVAYSGSNPAPVTIVSGALTSTIAVGDTLHDAADIGAAPLKVGGVAVQTNPTAVANGDRTNFRADDLGRQLIRPIQVRDLIRTAYATVSNGTETTLFAGTAATFADLIYIMASNASDAAVSIDVRDGTAGNIQTTIRIPANGTAGVSLPVPLPQSATGNTWTIDGPDETGRTITVSALFSQEV